MTGSVVVVDVWTVPVTPDRAVGDLTTPGAGVLAPAELARAAAMPTAAAGRRFLLGRALLRHALAGRLGCAPGEVDLRARCPSCGGPHGRVVVGRAGDPDRAAGLQVSVTRAGPLVAVAVCDGAPVGIDVESPRAVAAAPLADVALSPRELGAARRRRARGADRPDRSLARTWVRKEATLKALGTGLRLEPSSFDVRHPSGLARGVDAVVSDAEGREAAVADLRLGRGRSGAVAVAAPQLLRRPPTGDTGRAARRLVVRRYDGVSTLSGRSS